MTADEIVSLRVDLGKAKGLSGPLPQEEFGKLIGVRLMTVSRWERSVHQPSPMAVQRMGALRKKTQAKEL